MSSPASPKGAGSEPLRVALLTPAYPPEVSRGGERVVGELARGLAARGCVPRVVTSAPGAGSAALEDGIEVTRVRRPPERPLLARGFEGHLTHLPWSYSALRAGDDAIAHAHFHTDALAALRWGRERGRPVVLSFHGLANRATAAARRLRLATLSRALGGADRVVVSSRAAAEAMERWFGVEAVAIHPGVREEFFAAGERAERSEHPTIVCAADPDDPRKRIALLVGAFAELRRSRPDAELLIARPSRTDLATRYEETPGVRTFERTADPAALAEIYASAWVSALASYDEAFGLMLAEALACGLPAVGASDGGVPELLGDAEGDRATVGRLFERDDEASLARALGEALELAEDGATAGRCRERAAAFGVDRMCDAHLAIYRELLG